MRSPKDALLTAIDICDSTVDVAGAKFLPPLPYEQVTFKLQLVECNALIVRKRCGAVNSSKTRRRAEVSPK